MRENFTDIICITDKSGSMNHIKTDVIGGLNSFITEQKALEGDANLTIVFFDDTYELFLNGKDIKDAPVINESNYKPHGTTALYDAIGKTIVDIGTRLSETAEELRPSKVIVVIQTDGNENSSTKYTADDIKSMIELQQSAYNWEFIYIGANQDVMLSASSMGINNFASFNTATLDGFSVSTQNTYATMSKCVSSYRGTGNIGDLPDDIK